MPKLTNELTSLQRLLREGTLSRRDFVRRLLILGVSAGSAELLASCAPAQQAPVSPATPTHPPLHSSYGPTPTHTPLSAGGNLALGAAPPTYPTYTPAPEGAYPSPTATPVMWEAGLWMCPLCK
ncbi:MAG TPA: hypothetical protein PLN42_08475, partial [Anaerolineae bacterium]|nr:hypothetical protein [Anaerolineae bacterium]